LQKGANRLIKDNQGRTPYDIALKNNDKIILEMFKEKNYCKLFTTTTPLMKLEKQKLYLLAFYSYYFFIMIISLTLLIPCKYYIIYNIFIFFVL
jgi:hypothetical protein